METRAALRRRGLLSDAWPPELTQAGRLFFQPHVAAIVQGGDGYVSACVRACESYDAAVAELRIEMDAGGEPWDLVELDPEDCDLCVEAAESGEED